MSQVPASTSLRKLVKVKETEVSTRREKRNRRHVSSAITYDLSSARELIHHILYKLPFGSTVKRRADSIRLWQE